MKTVLSMLLALSVVASIAGAGKAFDAKSFYGQQERQSGGK
jgi:hypothetical protein